VSGGTATGSAGVPAGIATASILEAKPAGRRRSQGLKLDRVRVPLDNSHRPIQRKENLSMIRCALIFIILLSAVLCLSAPAQQNSSPSAPPAAAKIESDIVVLRVSGIPVTESQVMEMIDQLAPKQPLATNQKQERKVLPFKDAIENLTTVMLLKSQARAQNITVEKAVIDQQIQSIAKGFASPEDFQKALAKQNTTESDYRKNIEESMSMKKVLDLVVKEAPLSTEAELQKFYNDNPNKFNAPERVRASHILLKLNSKSTSEQKAELKKKLEGIRTDIQNQTISFADAAKKYSEDSTAQKGGDLGLFIRGEMTKPFEDVAFAMNPGTVSPVIETSFGYHVIQVTEIKPAGKETFEESKPSIQKYLDEAAKRKAVQKFVEELKQKATIEIFMTEEEFAQRHPSK
jgi:peptidyl-prolyl cis-trans isomerase C